MKDFFSDILLNEDVQKFGRKRSVAAGDVLILPGEEIRFVPLVLKGTIRILRQDEEGREVFLYHLSPGQTCAMSLTCCQAGKSSMIKAIAETDSDLVQIPVSVSNEWMNRDEWKSFVAMNYAERFAELMQVIDLIAFNNMDKQLMHYLEERSRALNTRILEITHQEIADELHSHREAISRLLRTMEQKKIVKLGRNSIELLL
jgi:CRP/FNR family transcriptional regulator, anaerobic regulatory protein